MINKSGKPKDLKRVNINLVLNAIKKRKTATRAELVSDTGISHTTVRNILSELLEKEEILVDGLDESSGGRRAERYSLNINKKSILIMYIEGRKLWYNISNIIGEEIFKESLDIEEKLSSNLLEKLLDKLFEKYNNIKAVGMAVPGIVKDSGYLSGLYLEDLSDIDIKKYIEDKYSVPVILENDLNSVALGFLNEYIKGNKDNFKMLNMIYMHFTRIGAGAGVIVNGSLVRGNYNYAGEIGFMKINNSYVNDLLTKELKDSDYVDLISKIISAATCLIDPKYIVLGGEEFRYKLIYDIVEETKKNNPNTKMELLTIEDSHKFGIEGISKLTLDLINEEIKLVEKDGQL
ncbi:ROK family protein [Clostridium cavendishii DSM 21758]|uniref:ROK family protein n=1 Tax=Clostridium cavendishii DSM 21758 TaxID=1121302 RepID=A0A1M6I9R5_9CLOT|nr:ROK family protein [Clostridium cavendishii]SHJ31171.1 ROK family protein [Clostridium cavendishii DSM 21758]